MTPGTEMTGLPGIALDFSAGAAAGASGAFEQEAVSKVTPPMGSDFRKALRRKL